MGIYMISNKNALLLKVNADQKLKKIKWKNVGCCVWVPLGTSNHKHKSTHALLFTGHKSSP